MFVFQVCRVDSMPAASRKRTNIFISHSLTWSVMVTSIEILDASALEDRSDRTLLLQFGRVTQGRRSNR